MEPETKVVSSEDQKEEPGNFAVLANVNTDSMSSPSCGASYSSGGAGQSSGASPFSGGASRSSGGATPFSGGASRSSHGASHSSGCASRSSGDASPYSGGTSRSSGGASRSSGDASPVGGSSEDGGITTHMGIKEIAGKSRSIQKKIKLPTQVALDAEGLLRTDFPFDQISARQELRTLTHNTLFPVHPKKRQWKIGLPVKNPQSC